MPHLLESGNLRLTPNEAVTYQAAARRLYDACELRLDLAQPINGDDWILLRIAHAALGGDPRELDGAIEFIEKALRLRRQSN